MNMLVYNYINSSYMFPKKSTEGLETMDRLVSGLYEVQQAIWMIVTSEIINVISVLSCWVHSIRFL